VLLTGTMCLKNRRAPLAAFFLAIIVVISIGVSIFLILMSLKIKKLPNNLHCNDFNITKQAAFLTLYCEKHIFVAMTLVVKLA
jgi:hypothetical protein